MKGRRLCGRRVSGVTRTRSSRAVCRHRATGLPVALGLWLWSGAAFATAEPIEIDEIDEIDEAAPIEVDEVTPVASEDQAPIEVDEVAPVAGDDQAPVEVDDAADEPVAEVDAAAATGAADAPVEATAEVEAGTEARDTPVARIDPEPELPPEPLPGDTHPDDTPPLAGARERWRAASEHLHFGGFVQVDFLRRQISVDELSDGTRQPLNETEFLLRNARLGVDADWRYVGLTGYAELFSNGQGVRPATFDVHAQLPRRGGGRPWVRLRVGLLRVPFGFENADQNDAQRFFGERTLVSHGYLPGLFDVGAALSGQVWALHWRVGVYNGQPVGAPGFGYRDPNAAKDYAGRLHLRGDLFPWLDAAVGFSFLRGTGFSAGTPATKDTFDWVDLNEDGRVTVAEIIPVAGTAGRPSENFRRWGLAGDIQLRSELPRVGQLMLYGELMTGQNLDRAIAIADPVLLRRDQRGLGWYVGLTQQLTRHATVGLRYDEYHPDLDALEPFDGTTVITRRRFRTLSAGAAAHLVATDSVRARLLFEYEYQRNSLGRDLQGRPANLDNDTFRVRAEVVF